MTVRIAGLYAVTPDLADTAELCSKVEQALRGGARVLQYRNKTAGDKLRIEQAAALQSLCRRYSVPLIINDHRPDEHRQHQPAAPVRSDR